MRKKIVAGNWKMNTAVQEGVTLAGQLVSHVKNVKAEVIIAPPFTHLASILPLLKNSEIKLAAQNCSSKRAGAFTGEISAEMLISIGVQYVIIGHSERRKFFHETNDELAEKTLRAVENNLHPIFCCGETPEERNAEKYFSIVNQQLEKGLFHLAEKDFSKCIIAYEPVWAIGTGVNASPEQAQEMHQFIRSIVSEKYNPSVADNITIIYGGSVTPQNAASLFSCKDVDGGLAGGASLKPEDFVKIISAIKI